MTIGLVVALIAASLGTVAVSGAAPVWSTPSLVFESEYSVAFGGYALVADASGNLHAFFSQVALDRAGNTLPSYPYNTIMYVKSDGVGWSQPVDVVINRDFGQWPGATIDAAADANGYLHLVLGNAPLQYYRAHVRDAASSKGWQGPASGAWGMRVSKAAVTVDNKNGIHLVYSLRPGDVYYRRSSDGGVTWGEDVRVSRVALDVSTTDDVAIAVDENGRVHVAWSENVMPGGYPPTGAYYARSNDGAAWSEAIQVGGARATRLALAVRGSGDVYVVWGTSLGDTGRYAVASGDRGVTWSQPQLVYRKDTGQTAYLERLVVDSADTLHWVITDDLGDLYTSLSSDRLDWSSPIRLTFAVPGDWRLQNVVAGGDAAVVLGNQLGLLVGEGAWRGSDRNSAGQRFWYVSTGLNAPGVAARSLPDPPRGQPGATPTTAAKPAAAVQKAESARGGSGDGLAGSAPSQTQAPLLIGVIGSSVVVFLVLLARIVRRRAL